MRYKGYGKNNARDDVQMIAAGGERMAQTARIQRDPVCTGRETVPQGLANENVVSLMAL